MKRSILMLTAGFALCLASCNSNEKGEGKNAVAEKNLEAVHGINKAIETGDVSKLGDYIAADAIDHSPEGDVKGLDSIKAHLAVIHTTSENAKTETIKEFADSTDVIQWMRYTGTCKVAMGPGCPIGSKYDMTVVHISKFKDGKAVEHWEFMLPGEMMKMMMPPPPMPKTEEPKTK